MKTSVIHGNSYNGPCPQRIQMLFVVLLQKVVSSSHLNIAPPRHIHYSPTLGHVEARSWKNPTWLGRISDRNCNDCIIISSFHSASLAFQPIQGFSAVTNHQMHLGWMVKIFSENDTKGYDYYDWFGPVTNDASNTKHHWREYLRHLRF